MSDGKPVDDDNKTVDGSRLLQAVQAIAISPQDAKAMAKQYKEKAKDRYPDADKKRIQDMAADKIISRYVWLASTTGAVSGLPGVIPGVGTVIVAGTALGDATLCMKFQIDMTMCMAEVYDYDVSGEDAQHIVFLVAGGAAVENLAGRGAVQIGSKAGVKMVQQYLKGAALVAVKEFFKRLGITFTRKALEKMVPFGIGVAVGGAGNYVLTKYVGYQAKAWFTIDRDM